MTEAQLKLLMEVLVVKVLLIHRRKAGMKTRVTWVQCCKQVIFSFQNAISSLNLVFIVSLNKYGFYLQ